jgi:hypothetical protein
MLVISREQMKAFQIKFNIQVAKHIRETIQRDYELINQNNCELELDIVKIIERAQNYGIYETNDLTTFAELDLLIMPGFDEHSRYQGILINKRYSSNRKMDFLCKTIEQDAIDDYVALQLPESLEIKNNG